MNKNKGDACTYRYSFEGEEMQQQAVKSTNYPFNPNDAYGELSEKKTRQFFTLFPNYTNLCKS